MDRHFCSEPSSRLLRPARVFAKLILVAVLALSMTGLGQEDSNRKVFAPQTGILWQPFQAWYLEMLDHPSNAFDVIATVVFSHEASSDEHRTQMFYAGDGRWSFRFTGTRTGPWSFVTTSLHPALDGWTGTVEVAPNPDPEATGFLTTAGSRFAAPSDEEGGLRARQLQVYMNAPLRNSLRDYPSEPEGLAAAADAILTEVEIHGFDALFVAMNNNWFAFGADSYADHDSRNPSLTSFEILETLILRAHSRGLGIHIWAWGDEERRWTPIGVGGINGTPDRRLQRYIAARLGPLPGWTMSYGFDLDEWVTTAEVRAWWSYLHEHLGWPHLLMAREVRAERQPSASQFLLGSDVLDVHSTDERPHADFYAAATAALEATGRPVLFERRFLHTRDGIWDMETTRRALWQFTLAGGAGAIWGVLWDGGSPYSEATQLDTHRAFWHDRWSLDMQRPSERAGAGGYSLHDSAGTRFITYGEATSRLQLDLTHMSGPQPAVAVDTKLPYAEIDIGLTDPGELTWKAPYESDWVVAVGTF
jgi:hypothetical protein